MFSVSSGTPIITSMGHLRIRDIAADQRGLLASSLVKMVIAFLFIAIPIYDGGSMLVNFFTLDSAADDIAVELTTNITPSQLRVDLLQPRAEELAKEAGVRLVGLTVEGRVLKVTIRRRANTLVVGRIGPIEDWPRATATGQAGAG